MKMAESHGARGYFVLILFLRMDSCLDNKETTDQFWYSLGNIRIVFLSISSSSSIHHLFEGLEGRVSVQPLSFRLGNLPSRFQVTLAFDLSLAFEYLHGLFKK